MNKLVKIIFITAMLNTLLLSYDGIATETLNIRETPSLDAKVIIKKYKNDKIYIIKKVYTKLNGTWYKTKKGYISAELIQFKNKPTKATMQNTYYVDASKLNNKISETFFDDTQGYTKFFIPRKIKKQSQISNNTNQKIAKKSIVKKYKYFVGALLGYTKLDATYNKINGAFYPISKSDESGLNFGWEAGYNIDKNSFTSVSYNQINLDDAKLYNYLISYNRILKDVPYNTYVGILGGISYIEVSSSPVNNLNNEDVKGRTTAIGVQIGATYKITTNINFFTQYQYLKAKHITHLVSHNTTAKVVRDDFNNINFGVRWGF